MFNHLIDSKPDGRAQSLFPELSKLAKTTIFIVKKCKLTAEGFLLCLFKVSGQQSPSDIFAIGLASLASLAATRRRSGRGLLQGCVGWPPS